MGGDPATGLTEAGYSYREAGYSYREAGYSYREAGYSYRTTAPPDLFHSL